jgi:hypothetical protein
MDQSYTFPASPGTPATPLLQASPDRVNKQRPQYEVESPRGSFHGGSQSHIRDSSVHEKVAVFNSLASRSKQLERQTSDAALKRAMLGREEAESETRRYRDEAKAWKRQVEEGKERERRVGARLEEVMVCIRPGASSTRLLTIGRKSTALSRKHLRTQEPHGKRR